MLGASQSFEYREPVCGGFSRLCWLGFSLRANIVERYLWFSAVLHVAVPLKSTCVDPIVVTSRDSQHTAEKRVLRILSPPRCLRAATVPRLPHHKFSARCCQNEHLSWLLWITPTTQIEFLNQSQLSFLRRPRSRLSRQRQNDPERALRSATATLGLWFLASEASRQRGT